jgi:uncharacterized protein YsxB (DUF464 family)
MVQLGISFHCFTSFYLSEGHAAIVQRNQDLVSCIQKLSLQMTQALELLKHQQANDVVEYMFLCYFIHCDIPDIL